MVLFVYIGTLCMCVSLRVCVCVSVSVYGFVCACICLCMCDVPVHAYTCCPSGAADCSWATGLNNAYGVAVDPSSGALFVTTQVANTNTARVCRVPASGGADDPRARA
jgi:hypothetical protein